MLYYAPELVKLAKKYISHGILAEQMPCIPNIGFIFAPEEAFSTNQTEVHSIADWLKELKHRKVNDVKIHIKLMKETPDPLVYFLGPEYIILCFYDDHITYWANDRFTFTEITFKDPPKAKPTYEDRTVQFSEVLLNIEHLAYEIGFDIYAETFREAHNILSNKPPIETADETKLRLYNSAKKASVFSGMGSWVDSADILAREKGLFDQCNRLTAKLYNEVMLAIMFAVNE